MTQGGMVSFVLGFGAVCAPLWACLKAKGSLDGESWASFLFELPLVWWARLQLAMWGGLMLMTFGLLT